MTTYRSLSASAVALLTLCASLPGCDASLEDGSEQARRALETNPKLAAKADSTKEGASLDTSYVIEAEVVSDDQLADDDPGDPSSLAVWITGAPAKGWINPGESVTVSAEAFSELAGVELPTEIMLFHNGEPIAPGASISGVGSHTIGALAYDESGAVAQASAFFIVPQVPLHAVGLEVHALACKPTSYGVSVKATLNVSPGAAAPLSLSSLRLYTRGPGYQFGDAAALAATGYALAEGECAAQVSFAGFLPGIEACPEGVLLQGAGEGEGGKPVDITGTGEVSDGEGEGSTTVAKGESGEGTGGGCGGGEKGPKPAVTKEKKEEAGCRWMVTPTAPTVDESAGDFDPPCKGKYRVFAEGLAAGGSLVARTSKTCDVNEAASSSIAWFFEPVGSECKCYAECTANLGFTLEVSRIKHDCYKGETCPLKSNAIAAEASMAVTGCLKEPVLLDTGTQVGQKDPIIKQWSTEWGFDSSGSLHFKKSETETRTIRPDDFYDSARAATKVPVQGTETQAFTINANSSLRFQGHAAGTYIPNKGPLYGHISASMAPDSGNLLRVRGRCFPQTSSDVLLEYVPTVPEPSSM